MWLSLVFTVALVLFGQAYSALPPGYEDVLLCPKGFCKEFVDRDGMVGPQRMFYRCRHPTALSVVSVKTWGTRTNVMELNKLLNAGFHGGMCDGGDPRNEVDEAEGPLFQTRLKPSRRLPWKPPWKVLKIYGNYCGPGWIAGRYMSGLEYVAEGGDFSTPCWDEVDCACRLHDMDCSTSSLGCSKKGDTELINSIAAYISDESSKQNPELRRKALFMKTMIEIARPHRKHRRLRRRQ